MASGKVVATTTDNSIQEDTVKKRDVVSSSRKVEMTDKSLQLLSNCLN